MHIPFKTITDINIFSGEQLVEHTKKIDDFVAVSRGTKISSQDDDIQDQATSEEGLENLQKLLGFERILRPNRVSRGVFEMERNRVKVVQIMSCCRACCGY